MGKAWLIGAAAVVVAMLPCGAVPAQPPPKGSVVPPPDEQRAVDEAAYRGMFLYAYDQASWQATDDMLTKIGPARSDVGGWLVDGDPISPEVVFYDKEAADPKALYVARFREGRLVQGRATNVALEKLKASGVTRCSREPFNIVAISPFEQGQPISVYFLVPRTDVATMPMGGHFMVPVSVPVEQAGGVRSKALVVTHDLTPTPTEIYVYASLSMKLPIAVSTSQNRKVWLVDGARIEPIEARAKPAAALPPETMTVPAGPVQSVRRGQLLHAYDQAAALATADFVAKAADADDLTDGWIVDGTVDAMDVIFANGDRGNPRTVYSARIERGVLVRSRVYREGSTIGMTPARRRMLDARYTAAAALRAHGRKYCSPGPPNTVVLPPEHAGEPMLVYFLSPRPERDMVPMGGHYRVPVSTVDGRAGRVESFPGCDLVDTRSRPQRSDVPTLTLDIDRHNFEPNEFHVYAAIALRDKLHVSTTLNDKRWIVTGDGITDAEEAPKKRAPPPAVRRRIARR